MFVIDHASAFSRRHDSLLNSCCFASRIAQLGLDQSRVHSSNCWSTAEFQHRKSIGQRNGRRKATRSKGKLNWKHSPCRRRTQHASTTRLSYVIARSRNTKYYAKNNIYIYIHQEFLETAIKSLMPELLYCAADLTFSTLFRHCRT